MGLVGVACFSFWRRNRFQTLSLFAPAVPQTQLWSSSILSENLEGLSLAWAGIWGSSWKSRFETVVGHNLFSEMKVMGFSVEFAVSPSRGVQEGRLWWNFVF